jgi:hypothetical protein
MTDAFMVMGGACMTRARRATRYRGVQAPAKVLPKRFSENTTKDDPAKKRIGPNGRPPRGKEVDR